MFNDIEYHAESNSSYLYTDYSVYSIFWTSVTCNKNRYSGESFIDCNHYDTISSRSF